MPTTRSRPQVIFRHLLGSVLYLDDESSYGRVKDVSGSQDSSIDINRLTDRIRSVIDQWKSSVDGESGIVYPDVDYLQPTQVEAIRPEYVEWEVFPYYYRCQRIKECGVWQYKKDIIENQGRCVRCGQHSIEQTPFVWVHHCGYLVPLAPGKRQHCPRHKQGALYLHDTGTFTTSSWRCRDCGHQAPIGFLQCPQCTSTNPRPQPMRWNDPGVFSTVSFQMINLPQEDRDRLHGAPARNSAISAVLSGALQPGSNAVREFAESSGRRCPQCGAQVAATAKFCSECGSLIPTADAASATEPDAMLEQVIDDLVAYSLLWDLPGTSALSLSQEWDTANAFGVADVIYLERFPLTLVGLGYRRQRSKRPATLCLFPAASSTKSMRVFTNSYEAEACGLRLRPDLVLNWLHANELAEEAAASESPLEQLQEVVTREPAAREAVYGLLHSISHAYIVGLSWCSGMDISSFSEELLPGMLAAIVHAGDTSLGGLSSVFAQTPWQPLEMAAEDLVSCQFDPACTEDDFGSCVGCLHLPMGCVDWNSSLSRAYLFGGQLTSGHVIKQGFWQYQS